MRFLCADRSYTADLRNTFAMNLWQVERDLVGLAEMMGLESVESAKIYAQMGTASETPDTKRCQLRVKFLTS